MRDRTWRGAQLAVHTERVDSQTLRFAKGYWKTFGAAPDEPLTATRGELVARLHEARWLLQHVHYIVASGLSTRQYLGSRPVAIAKPPADPKDWDGTVMVFLDGNS